MLLLLVDAKIAGLRERSTTDITSEVLLSLALYRLMLELPVSTEIASSAECPLAHLTGVWFLSAMDLLVQLKECWVRESFVANVALVITIQGVLFGMGFQPI